MSDKVKQNNEIIKTWKQVSIDSVSIMPENGENVDFIKIGKVWKLDDEKKEVQYKYDYEIIHPMLKDIVIDMYDFRFVRDLNLNNARIYLYEKGVYKWVSENEFKGKIASIIPSLFRRSKDIDEVYKLLLLENTLYIDNSELNSNENLICFKNGILNLDTMEIEDHNPTKIFSIQIPYDYKSLDYCTYGNVFEKYLNDLCDGDDIMKNLLLECMGLAISNIPGYRVKKCLLMVGEKDSGKTQIKKLLTKLIGTEYCSSSELSSMSSSNKFGTSDLYNKRLAGSNDMSYAKIDDMSMFKQLTGGDTISVEFKGRTPFSYTFTGFLWFLANDYPKFSGKKENAIYERFLIAPCTHVVKENEQDPELLNKMLNEGEYIVSLCIQHLLDLKNRHYKFITSEKMNKALDHYKVMNNSLLQFVEECCDIDDMLLKENRVTFPKFRRYYQRWCNETGVMKMALTNDNMELYLNMKYGTEKKRSNGYYYWSNIKMKQEFLDDYGTFSSN